MRQTQEHPEDPRRRLLLQALVAGIFSTGLIRDGVADALGKVPKPLPPGKSIYELNGSLTVNGAAATEQTIIHAGDTLETHAGSHVIFVSGKDAFIMRENSRLELSGEGFVIHNLRLVTGALLSVFGKGEHRVETLTATAGIRGTGMYVEVLQDESYMCTCYGTTQIASISAPNDFEIVSATHHDARYVLANGKQRIRKAPFKNHTDLELTLIEALVGRVPPFALFDDSYGNPRRY